ncbi:MAG: TatD family hydrolase [Deltaproteobacteria bacterium]|nr:TatD family hydrolase [Deltaproteobacteria bacterium]MBT4642001.1 TatD family hydrolase [Deltaproteobacteria bacterium]MBT6499599.1 TatD family hydrolase [Deltaproteobacteria bacterium]MBT6612011.1 TatD family hydrolase [Deltaproteobacteria bacterium]MBT7151444.1 TatD family hydrolase [Deltaproteobacteria bacterium]
MPYIDTHCHLDFEAFDTDRPGLMQRCREKGVTHFILPGVTQNQWRKLLLLGQQHKEIAVAPGLHPCFIQSHHPSHLEELQTLLASDRDKIIGVGEIGLDYFIKALDRQRQISFFEEQVRLAKEYSLPLLLHVRKAHDEVLHVIRRLKFEIGGIVHCYSGSLQQAQKYLENGFKIGIGGVITYQNANRLQKIVKTLPLSAFVFETDAPDVPLAGRQNQTSSPENLPQICQAFSQHRDEPEDQVAAQLYRNTLELFPQLEV